MAVDEVHASVVTQHIAWLYQAMASFQHQVLVCCVYVAAAAFCQKAGVKN